mgnify:FL=1
MAWLEPMRFSLKKVFTVQGEEEGSEILAKRIINDLAVKAEAPAVGSVYDLT